MALMLFKEHGQKFLPAGDTITLPKRLTAFGIPEKQSLFG
jgi:hypothetical protein